MQNKKEYWLRVCAREVGNPEKVREKNLNYAKRMIDNAIEHGFLMEAGGETSAVLILQSMILAGQIPRMNRFAFFREWVLEKQAAGEAGWEEQGGNVGYAFSGEYPTSWPYTHFVTGELDAGNYVERCMQMISPDWEKEHENSPNVYLYISERMGRLEKLFRERGMGMQDLFMDRNCLEDKGLLDSLAREHCKRESVASFEELVQIVRTEQRRGLAEAVLEAVYWICEEYFGKTQN